MKSDSMLIAFGEKRDNYLFVRNGEGWFRLSTGHQWWPLTSQTVLPGLGGKVLVGTERAEVVARVGEPTP